MATITNPINAAAPMTAEQARAVFDAALVAETDPDRIARVELLREYFTNPDFRNALHEQTRSAEEAP